MTVNGLLEWFVHPQLHEVLYDFLVKSDLPSFRLVSSATSDTVLHYMVEVVVNALQLIPASMLSHWPLSYEFAFTPKPQGREEQEPKLSAFMIRYLKQCMQPDEFHASIVNRMRWIRTTEPVFQPILSSVGTYTFDQEASQDPADDIIAVGISLSSNICAQMLLEFLLPRCTSLEALQPAAGYPKEGVVEIIKAAGGSLKRIGLPPYHVTSDYVHEVVAAISSNCPNVEYVHAETLEADALIQLIRSCPKMKSCSTSAPLRDEGILQLLMSHWRELESLKIAVPISSFTSSFAANLRTHQLPKIQLVELFTEPTRPSLPLAPIMNCFPNLTTLLIRGMGKFDDVLIDAMKSCPNVDSLALCRSNIERSTLDRLRECKWKIRCLSVDLRPLFGSKSSGSFEDLLAAVGSDLRHLRLNEAAAAKGELAVIAAHCPALESIFFSAFILADEDLEVLKTACKWLKRVTRPPPTLSF